ncbi:MAG: ribonuclease [Marmoricola sp.]|nr:ribonuclease [Marmoricola sp.]
MKVTPYGGPMGKLVDDADAFQRRHAVIGLPLGVIYKFFDDQGNYLAAIITYYAFIAIFPLLLIASSVLGFLLQGNHTLEREVLNSALRQFPIVGTQLGQPKGIRGSTWAIVVGALTALYGTIGFGQAAQNAVSVTLAIPRNSRLNPITSRLRSLLLLLVAGLMVLGVAVATILASHTELFGINLGGTIRWGLRLASVTATAAVLAVMVRFSSSKQQSMRQVIPGAIATALLWQLLQTLGGVYVDHVIAKASSMNSVFALVLGLLALIYLAAAMAILGLEINSVLGSHLYPRALLTPFTDAVQLTDADRRVYTAYATAQRHKGFQRVHVDFDDTPESQL